MNILEYSSGHAIPPSYSKKIQDVGIPWVFKNSQAHKSWTFLGIPSSFFPAGSHNYSFITKTIVPKVAI